jgi:acetate kinase
MTKTILVINAGSSSVKFQLFGVTDHDRLRVRVKGQIEGIGSRPRLLAKDAADVLLVDSTWPDADVGSVPKALDKVVGFLRDHVGGNLPAAIGHRVVHGGADYNEPAIITDAVLDRLRRLAPPGAPSPA